jgi:GTP-binding protein
VPTSRVNEILQDAQGQRPTPRNTGTLHYATQVGAGPPTFVVFGGARPPDATYRRFLENRLRGELGLQGVPIELRFRARRRAASGG